MVVDVGCGIGAGANYISQEASFVWGIDKNEKSVKFAKEAFERVKNGIYYSAQVTFDHIDIMEDTRDFQKFDVIVAVEVVEHLKDHNKFLRRIIDKLAKPEAVFFISTPNRNNKSIRKDRPYNQYHVKEFTSGEFVTVLRRYFTNVELMSAAGIPIPIEEYETTTHTPLLSMCSGIK